MKPPTTRKRSRLLRWIERLLLLAGLAAVGVWVASNAVPAILHDWDGWVFDHEARHQQTSVAEYLRDKKDRILTDVHDWWSGFPGIEVPLATKSAPAPSPDQLKKGLATNALIGHLTIPRLHLDTTVREGVHETTLSLAAGHVPSTSLPGDKGNVGVAGHRDTLFLGLRDIQDKDVIQFETLKGIYIYQVESTKIVKPTDVAVLKAGRYPQLTLVTCYPFNYIGSAPQRFIVKARQLSAIPRTSDLAESKVRAPAPSPKAPPDLEAEPSGHSEPPAHSKSRVEFSLSTNHSRLLAPGISMGVTGADSADGTVDGWMWVMPDRRTIWLRNQPAYDPVIFYQDDKPRELLITRVTRDAVTGYLLVAPEEQR
jgi:sortase A